MEASTAIIASALAGQTSRVSCNLRSADLLAQLLKQTGHFIIFLKDVIKNQIYVFNIPISRNIDVISSINN